MSFTDFYSYDQYRPPGRSARSGRAHNDNDVFEGLPVKQWGQQISHVSLAPPKIHDANQVNDKWADPPMPRDYQLLQPWTQHLLRLARSGKVGTKRKPDPDSMDEDKPEDEANEDAKPNLEDRGYVAKKWKPVPEALLEPEHKHFEFLAKRRRGLPSLYGPEQTSGIPVPMRKTKVQRTGAEGEVVLYEVLIPEGQTMEGEVADPTTLPPEIVPATVAPGTVIEGLGIADDTGVVVAEHLKPTLAPAQRRNRPPPKKKGGPGRGKKRVTFTNPDGSTYTTVVPNATKIVPQPGQTVKHVAKGEEATADVSAAQAAATRKEGDESGDDEGDDDGDEDEDDDGREEGEITEDEGKSTAVGTPVPSEKKVESEPPVKEAEDASDDIKMEDAPVSTEVEDAPAPPDRDASSSPELPLAKTSSHSRTNSQILPPPTTSPIPSQPSPAAEPIDSSNAPVTDPPAPIPAPESQSEAAEPDAAADTNDPSTVHFDDGDEDLLGSLEKSIGDTSNNGGSGGEVDSSS